MLNVNTANKAELRAEMRALDLDPSGLNEQALRDALTAHYSTLSAESQVVAEELPIPAPAVTVPEAPVVAEVVPELPAPTVPVVIAAPVREESYGVKRPGPGTICAQIWGYCDHMYSQGHMPQAKALRAWGAGKLDDVTMTVQFYRWRKFNGIRGRQ